MQLVLASRNAHKLRELSLLLAPHELVELPQSVELPPETGATFAENALVKARAAAAATGMPAVADDSGIEAAALGGAPGIYSARFAGEDASDGDNLAKLLRDVPPGGDTRVAYVCALVLVEMEGRELVAEGRCRGRLTHEPRGQGGFGYDPAVVPDDHDDGRTMAELTAAEKDAISHRGRAARELLALIDRETRVTDSNTAAKARAAALSILSNTLLIALKLVAGVITGSIAIITEAIHSSVDLIASIVAFVSVRKAGEPADADHPYGHDKIENLAAVIEGLLILVGAGIIVFESVRRLVDPPEVESLGIGIAVIAFSVVANLVVSAYLYRQARATESPALEGDAAHLRTDALTSVGVLVGLVLVQLTGFEWVDPLTALVVAVAIVVAGLRILMRSSRVLVDEVLPDHELAAVHQALEQRHRAPEIAGYHKLRARRAGSRRYIDLHVQFHAGTSLDRAHAVSHELQEEIRGRLDRADVLIHLEPERR